MAEAVKPKERLKFLRQKMNNSDKPIGKLRTIPRTSSSSVQNGPVDRYGGTANPINIPDGMQAKARAESDCLSLDVG